MRFFCFTINAQDNKIQKLFCFELTLKGGLKMGIKMNLKTKMLAMILAPVIILTGFLSLYGYNTSKDALNNQILETNRFTMESYSESLNSILVQHEARTKQLALNAAGKTPEELQSLIRLAKDASGKYSTDFSIGLEKG